MFSDFDTMLRCRFVATLRMFAVLGGGGGCPTTAGFFALFFFFLFLLTDCSSERQECSDPVAAEESKCMCAC